MLPYSHCRALALTAIATSFFGASFATAQTAITSGFDLSVDGPVFEVPFSLNDHYRVDVPLIFDPKGGPMTKNFATPRFETGAPIQIDALQPFPFVVNENFPLVAGVSNHRVSDWHEIILTPGWAWIRPGSSAFPALFPPGTSLITRDGLPWPSTDIPGSGDPNRIDVQFSPIEPGHVLDIHKALLWVGTTDNRIWGDNPNESFIRVLEYPTPEPSSFVLAGFAVVALLLARKRLR